jgi:chlorobactene glucosyltransferase
MGSPWIDSLLVLCAFSTLVSLGVAIQFIAAVRRIAWHPPAADGPVPGVRVTVIVPARDEEADLEASVRSLLQQESVDFEVIVVNDHSSDGTGAIADTLAREDARVRVIHNPMLPAGWLGKPNAMQQAAASAQGNYLLFSDADITHRPGALATALAEAERDRLDFLSLFPLMHCVSLWENVLTPAFVGAIAQFATPGLTDPRSPDALAAGAFLLVRSDVFLAVGGFAPIRHAMFDDVGLARLLKKHGYRVGFYSAPQLLEVRLFKNNHHAFWGLTKNVLEGLNGRLWLAPAVLFLPPLLLWAPVLGVAVGILRGQVLLTVVAALAFAIQYVTFWFGRRLFRFQPGKALLFPLAVAPLTCCLLRALYYYVARGSVHWRGRVVQIRQGLGQE